MPSDPVKAVWWFMHWLLRVLVPFFWIPILGMVIYEAISNGLVYGIWTAISSGVITLLVGLIVWAVLYVLLIFANISANVVRVVNDLNQFQQKFADHVSDAFPERDNTETKIVEGTIAEVEEEPQRQKKP
jgi:hypothetical protein